MESTLHPAVDSQEPDSERSPKRIRLDGALDVTEDVQEEIVDDDDGWDDIYAASTAREEQPSAVEMAISNPAPPTHAPEDSSTTPAAAHNGAEPHLELAPHNEKVDMPPNNQVSDRDMGDGEGDGHGDVVDGIPSEALYGGDEPVAETGDEMAVDRPGTHAMEGMSEVIGPEDMVDGQNGGAPGASAVLDGPNATNDGNGGDIEMQEAELLDKIGRDPTSGAIGLPKEENSAQEAGNPDELRKPAEGTAAPDRSVNKEEPTVGLLQMLAGDMPKAPVPKATDDPEFMAAAAEQSGNKEAEWQLDPSDAESSSDDSSDSDSDSDSSSDDSDGGYELLDAATAAKILMSGDGEDGDDGGGKKKGGGPGEGPRTANEQKELAIKKPDVQIAPDAKITLLGRVENIVENMLLIKGATPGEYQVLESGSVLCNEKREVFGVVGDTLGRVQEPLYSVLFNNAQEVQEAGLQHASKVYYVDEHSSYVFTQPLKNMKGTDASNIHDEEAGDDEVEFSDDEAEAAWKRQKKYEKMSRRGDTRGGGRGGWSKAPGGPGRDDGDTSIGNAGNDAPQQDYGGALAYDDGDAEDDFYKPLKRPDNLAAIMAGDAPMPKPQNNTGSDRGRGRGRGGGSRGRGDRGGGRGRGGGYRQDFKGNAHSFPDRHNNDPHPQRSNTHQSRQPQPLPPRPNSPPWPGSRPSSSATTQPQPQYPPPPYTYPPQPQTYQFNGYTYQYGNPQAQATATPPAYNNYAAYGNPQQQQAPSYGLTQPAQAGYGGAWAQHHQQAQQQQPGAGPGAGAGQQMTAEQLRNLAAFLQTRGAQ